MIATVLTDAHKFGPAHFGLPSLYLMNDHERSDTMAAPPPSQDEIPTDAHASAGPLRETQPPGADDAEAERVMKTMLPPGAPGEAATPAALAAVSDSLLLEVIKQVTDAARTMREERDERRASNVAQLDMQSQILQRIAQADDNQQRNHNLLRNEILNLKESDIRQDRRLAEGDERFGRIERSIEELKVELIQLITRATEDAAKRIGALEDELADAKAQRDAAPTPT